ncbi:MAG: ribonuclease P protein component [Verrucomicrobia bacterium]|nr:ribonuclease P protein component [Verrucomicrobiota bacterium]
MRFCPKQHLRRPGEIRAVRERGRRLDGRAFTLWWKPGSGAPTARVCVVASRAAVGSAVVRNRAKRRLREVFRRQQAGAPAGCDLLLIARRAATTVPWPELERQFADACRRIALVPEAKS